MVAWKISVSTTEDKVHLVHFLDLLLNFLFPRRAIRLCREPYEALGACMFTSTARFLGGPNMT